MQYKIERRLALTLVGLFLSGMLANATEGIEEWVRHYRGPIGSDEAHAVVADTAGNIIVTGSSGDEYGVSDIATVAFSSTGIPLWTNRFDGKEGWEDEGTAVAVDTNGNTLVTGYTETMVGRSIVTIKYSSSGMPLWTNFFDGPAESSNAGVAVKVGSVGNVIVVGRSRSADLTSRIVTIAFSNDGIPLWTNLFESAGPRAMVIDNDGNVVVTGTASNPLNGDFVTVKYSNAGIPVWTNLYDSGAEQESDVAYALATDKNGNVFVTGSGGRTGEEFTTMAYSSSGVPLWTNRLTDFEIDEGRVSSIAVGPNGNVVVTGYLSGREADYATIAYSPSGAPLWTNFFSAPFSDRAFGVAVDSNNNVFVTGSSRDFNDSIDILTVAYSGNGTPLWYKNYGSGADHSDSSFTKESIVTTGTGQVVIVGYSGTDDPDESEYVILKYSTVFPSLAPTSLAVSLIGNELELSWPASHTGWQLQYQTSETGVGTNWTPILGSMLTNRVIFPASATSRFYRLAAP